MVKYFGGKVFGYKDGLVEIGYYLLFLIEVGQDLMEWFKKVYQWYCEGFDFFSGVEFLVISLIYENQVICVGLVVYGIQFYFEFIYQMMVKWIIKGVLCMEFFGVQYCCDYFVGCFVYDGVVCQWLDWFLDLWIGMVEQFVQYISLKVVEQVKFLCCNIYCYVGLKCFCCCFVVW